MYCHMIMDYIYDNQIKQDDIDGACNMYGREKKYIKMFTQ